MMAMVPKIRKLIFSGNNRQLNGLWRFVRDAEDENRDRIEQRTFRGRTGNQVLNNQLLTLEPGEETTIKDKWVRDVNTAWSALRHLDAYLTFGNVKISSTIEATARREGNSVHFEGTVTHTLTDPYDFHRGAPLAHEPLVMREYGGAKDFEITGTWQQKVSGTVAVRDVMGERRLLSPTIDWEDIEPTALP